MPIVDRTDQNIKYTTNTSCRLWVREVRAKTEQKQYTHLMSDSRKSSEEHESPTKQGVLAMMLLRSVHVLVGVWIPQSMLDELRACALLREKS
jgi:hypothetical protein